MLIILNLILFINSFKNLLSECQPRAVQGWQIVFISCANCGCGCSKGRVENNCKAKAGLHKNEYYSQFKVSSVEGEERNTQGTCHP